MDVKFEIKQVLAELSTYQNQKKLLTLTEWNDRDPKLDLRTWEEKDGKLSPRKGVTLNEAEGRAVEKALYDYFKAM